MEKIKLLLIVSVLFICGCDNNQINSEIKHISYEDFGECIELIGEELPFDSLWKPSRIYCIDSSLVMIDKTCDNMVQVFHKDKFYKITEAVPYGIGPNESLSCWTLQFFKDYVLMFDLQLQQSLVYNKNDFLSKHDVIPLWQIKLEHGTSDQVLLTNGKVLAECLYDENTFLSLYDTSGVRDEKFIMRFPDIKTEDNSDFSLYKKRLFEPRLYYNEVREKIFVTYTYTDLFDIFDNDLNLISRVYGPECFPPLLVDKNDYWSVTDETKTSTVSSCLTENFIWVLYCGDKMGSPQDRILVFDYEGNPKYLFHLNLPIIGFCVDENSKAIFATANNPDRCVMKFQY